MGLGKEMSLCPAGGRTISAPTGSATQIGLRSPHGGILGHARLVITTDFHLAPAETH